MKLETRTTDERQALIESPITFGEKRPCEEPGCITCLNRYHAGCVCYVHERRRPRAIDSARLMAEAKS